MKEIYVKRNKYIRLRVAKVGFCYRADISINKYFYDRKQERYYEINFGVFSPYDYKDEKDTLENAIKWLKEEANKFQECLKKSE